MQSSRTILQTISLIVILLLFFTSIELMGESFKLMGRGFAEALLQATSNPFVGLFIGILATSLVQSSSTVTSMTVGIVAGGGLTIAGAIPIVMGANIGTSVTNTIVSFGSVTRKEEFRRAMAAATVHDFFNLLAVAVLFPLELMFQIISGSASVLTDSLANVGGTDLLSPLMLVIDPIAEFIIHLTGSSGVLVLIVGLIFLFISLRYLVVLLKALVLGRSEALFHKYLFGAAPVALLFGVLLTFMVQSSSITTSITVPLVAAGIVSVAQIFPFVLGANIGTTLTALLAGLALASTGEVAAIASLKVAFAHLVFNVYGIALFLPIPFMRNIPIKLSKLLGDLTVRNRLYALGYVGTVFFLIPLVTIFTTRNLAFDYSPPKPDVLIEAMEEAEQDSLAASDSTRADTVRLSPRTPVGGLDSLAQDSLGRALSQPTEDAEAGVLTDSTGVSEGAGPPAPQ
ncbi:MAG: Na/Pi symporter [Bacteroidota bacterium]